VLIKEDDLGLKGHQIGLDWSRIGRAASSGSRPPPYEKKSLKKGGRTSGGSAEAIGKYFSNSHIKSYFNMT
jgi:hypothetical protein